MTDHIQKTRDMIAVMQAYVDGSEIEARERPYDEFVLLPRTECCFHVWNWDAYDYRVAVTKDSIEWSHVSPDMKFMARDKDGDCFLFKAEPELRDDWWSNRNGSCSLAEHFSSYRRGNVDWKDSLVRRPE